MSISFVAAATYNSGSGSSANVALTVPATAAVGDVMVVATHWGVNGTSNPPGTVAGWTLEISDTVSSSVETVGIYTRRVQSGDPGTTVNFPLATGVSRQATGLMLVYRGVDSTTILDAAIATDKLASGGDPVMPSATAATAGAMAVGFVHHYYTSQATTGTYVDPSGWTQRAATTTTTTSTRKQAAAYETTVASAGSNPGFTINITPDSNSWMTQHILLKPAITSTRVTKTATASYNVLARASKTATAAFDVLARSSRTATASYNTLFRSGRTATATFDVRQRVTKNGTASYNLSARDTTGRPLSYDVNQRVTSSSNLTYHVLVRGTKASTLSFDVSGRTTKNGTLAFNVAQRGTKTGSVLYDVQVSGSSRVTKNGTLGFNVAQRSTLSRDLLYDVRKRVDSPGRSVLFDALQRGSRTATLTFDISSRVTKTAVGSYDVKVKVTKSGTISFHVAGRTTKAATLSYNTLSELVSASLGLWFSDGVTMHEIQSVHQGS